MAASSRWRRFLLNERECLTEGLYHYYFVSAAAGVVVVVVVVVVVPAAVAAFGVSSLGFFESFLAASIFRMGYGSDYPSPIA